MKKILIFLVVVIAAAIGFVAGKSYFSGQSTALVAGGQAIPAGAATTPVSVVSLFEPGASSSPMVSVEYPQFSGANSAFNQAISSSTLGTLADFRQSSSDNQALSQSNGAPIIPLSSYTFNASWQNAQVNSRYISFVERYSYWNGGASEINDLQTFNYDVGSGKIMTLADLFPNFPDYLKRIARTAKQQLSENLNAGSSGDAFLTEMINEGTQPTVDNFQLFTFTDFSVTLYFPQCSVAACSYGEQKVTLPRDISSL